MSEANGYKHLSRRYRSAYKQFFVTGTRLRAGVLYEQMGNGEYQTPAELAADYNLPVEVVEEAIHYCEHNPEVLEEDRLDEEEIIRRHGWDKPPRVPPDYLPDGQ